MRGRGHDFLTPYSTRRILVESRVAKSYAHDRPAAVFRPEYCCLRGRGHNSLAPNSTRRILVESRVAGGSKRTIETTCYRPIWRRRGGSGHNFPRWLFLREQTDFCNSTKLPGPLVLYSPRTILPPPDADGVDIATFRATPGFLTGPVMAPGPGPLFPPDNPSAPRRRWSGYSNVSCDPGIPHWPGDGAQPWSFIPPGQSFRPPTQMEWI